MALRVVGAGHSRTGTLSLKRAFERLLGAPCYHMLEVFMNPTHVPIWQSAARGEFVDWDGFLSGYSAAVDWPASAFWAELSCAFPEAVVVLSVRDSESWWSSARSTIFPVIEQSGEANDLLEWRAMMDELARARFTIDLNDREACIAAFERNTEEVLRQIPKERLIVWRPGDGWEPLCSALEVDVPDEPFPLVNTREQFLAHNAGK